MDSSVLVTQIKFNMLTLRKNLEGVEDKASEVNPKVDVNSMKWIVQHLLTTRIALLRNLGLECPDEDVIYTKDLDGLVDLFEEFQQTFSSYFEREPNLANDKAEMITKYMLHESYHIGQIGVGRRFIGLPGALY